MSFKQARDWHSKVEVNVKHASKLLRWAETCLDQAVSSEDRYHRARLEEAKQILSEISALIGDRTE